MPENQWIIVDVGSGAPLAFQSRSAAEEFILSHDFPTGQTFTMWLAHGNDRPIAKVKLALTLSEVVE